MCFFFFHLSFWLQIAITTYQLLTDDFPTVYPVFSQEKSQEFIEKDNKFHIIFNIQITSSSRRNS